MKHSYIANVVTLALDDAKCLGCGKCIEVCPHGVFALAAGKTGYTVRLANRDACMECGACALNCPAQALTVEAGVGCAAAIIMGWFTGQEPVCGCGEGECC